MLGFKFVEVKRSSFAVLLSLSIGLSGCFNAEMSWNSTSAASSAPLQLKWTAVFNQPTTLKAGQVVTPSPQVSVIDSSGAVVTSGSYSIYLSVYSDSACSQSLKGREGGGQNDSPEIFSTHQGVATLNGLKTDESGAFYVLAHSPEGPVSACSQLVTVEPGAADHIDVVTTSPYTSSLNTTTPISVQVVDAYGNPTSPPASGVSVTFAFLGNASGMGSIGLPPGASSSTSVADSKGLVSSYYNAPNASTSTRYVVIQATPTGLPNLEAISIPIFFQSGPLDHFNVTEYPPSTLINRFHWAKVMAVDANENPVSSFTGQVFLHDTQTSTSLNFESWDAGVKYMSFSASQVLAAKNLSASLVNNLVSQLGYQPISTIGPACISSVDWNSTTSGNWSVPSNWNGGAVPIASYSQLVRFNQGSSCSVDVSNVSTGCLSISSGALLVTPSVISLQITGDSMFVGSPGGLIDNSTGVIKFSGDRPQYFSSPAGPTGSPSYMYLNSIEKSSSSASSTFLSFERGDLAVGTFVLQSGSFSSLVYVNGNLSIQNKLTVPNSVEVIVNPGGVLIASGGIDVASGGRLTVRSGGQLLIGTGKLLDIQNGGAVKLDGTPGARAFVGASPQTPGSSFSFTVESGGEISAHDFQIADLGSQGLYLMASSLINSMENGQFSHISSGGAALTLGANLSFANSTLASFLGLQFDELEFRSDFTPIDASALVQSVAVIVSPHYGNATRYLKLLKSRVADPNDSLVFGR
jgi:hypothetical protein